MNISTKDLQDIAQKILATVNTSDAINNTNRLQLKLEQGILHVSVASDEFFVDVTLPASSTENLNVVVNANLFLKLIAQMTTDFVGITFDGNIVTIKGNGTYTLPLLQDSSGNLPELNPIPIKNEVQNIHLNSDLLLSLLKYNAKQLTTVKVTSSPLQRVFYMDECGAITFTEGACVNNFSLSQPLRVLLSPKVVKLFKLFEKDQDVELVVGYDAVGGMEEIIQTKVRFSTPTVTISAILACDDTLLNSYPVDKIRQTAAGPYPYSTSVSKIRLADAVNRLLLFHSTTDVLVPLARVSFREYDLVLQDTRMKNAETVDYVSEVSALAAENSEVILNLNELKTTLDTCTDDYITLHFGSPSAIVIARGNVVNVIPVRG